ncbi:hypothetical protein C1H46_034106 [Malus baccata]|uniref:Uncharacterized protein n=1 Tax=Malus baccata TaxID=106549 RepID=A0A540L1M1_MALBA|nr:hypothetical protein C1H46_034106 [Malus baccata]
MTSSTGSSLPSSSPSLLRYYHGYGFEATDFGFAFGLPPHRLGHLRHDCFTISVNRFLF